MAPKKYRHFPVPDGMVERIEEYVRDENEGYPSITAFINDALRRRLEELEKKQMIKAQITQGGSISVM